MNKKLLIPIFFFVLLLSSVSAITLDYATFENDDINQTFVKMSGEEGKTYTITLDTVSPYTEKPEVIFDLYDDFNDGILNTSLWLCQSSCNETYENGSVLVKNVEIGSAELDLHGMESIQTFQNPYMVAMVKWTELATNSAIRNFIGLTQDSTHLSHDGFAQDDLMIGHRNHNFQTTQDRTDFYSRDGGIQLFREVYETGGQYFPPLDYTYAQIVKTEDNASFYTNTYPNGLSGWNYTTNITSGYVFDVQHFGTITNGKVFLDEVGIFESNENKYTLDCNDLSCNVTLLENLTDEQIVLPIELNESVSVTLTSTEEKVYYGVNHNKTYYKENFFYLYNFSEEENNGLFEADFNLAFQENNSCLSNSCLNSSKGVYFSDGTNYNYTSLEDYSISMWIRTNETSTSSLFPVNIFELENPYRTGGSILIESFAIGLDENGEIVIDSQINTGFYQLDTGITPTNNDELYFTFVWNGNNIQIWEDNEIVYNQTVLNPKIIHNFQELQLTDGGTTLKLGETGGVIIDDFTFSNFAYDKEDIEQLIYYTEQEAMPELENAPFPTGATLTQPNNTIITLGSGINVEQTFLWIPANDPLLETITYSLSTGNMFLQATQSNNFTYNFTYGQWSNGTYDVNIESCNSLACGDELQENAFSICINNWEEVLQPCTENLKYTVYEDLNNCPIKYDVPIDNGTYVECVDPTIQAEIDSNRDNLLLILLFVVIVLLMVVQLFNIHPIVSIVAGILNILVIAVLFSVLNGDYIIMPIVALIMQIGLFFFIGIQGMKQR